MCSGASAKRAATAERNPNLRATTRPDLRTQLHGASDQEKDADLACAFHGFLPACTSFFSKNH
jgi:hypothetical protein